MRRLLDTLANANPWLVLLPFLGLYVAYALTMVPHDHLILDEGRYWGFAENLLNGHFHYKEGYQFLWSGPGYPLLLVPFVAFDSPLWVLKVLNAVLLYLSVVFLFKTLCLYVSRQKSLLVTILFACYYPMYEVGLPFVMTEAWSMFLTVMGLFLICRAFRLKDFRFIWLLLPALCLGMLALTKVIYGYALAAMIVICLVWWLVRKRPKPMWHMTKVFLLAMAVCMPYLVYTYSLTGKPFYWGNSGGLQLYWMATPYEDELGDWHVPTLEEDSTLMKNHGAFFREIAPLGPVQQDEALTRQAVANIKAHPKKYAYNWIANLGRTFFSHPLSFLKPSNGLFKYLVPNMFLLVFVFLAGLPTLRYAKRFPRELLVLVVFSFVYLGGISLVASYPRFLYMNVPIWLVWISWTLNKFLRLRLQVPKTVVKAEATAQK